MVDKLKKLDIAIDELNEQVSSVKSFGDVLARIQKLVDGVEVQDHKVMENVQKLENASKHFKLGVKDAGDIFSKYQKKNADLIDGLSKEVTVLDSSLQLEINRIREELRFGINDLNRVLSEYQERNSSSANHMRETVSEMDEKLRLEIDRKTEDVRRSFKINTIVTLTALIALTSFTVWIAFFQNG